MSEWKALPFVQVCFCRWGNDWASDIGTVWTHLSAFVSGAMPLSNLSVTWKGGASGLVSKLWVLCSSEQKLGWSSSPLIAGGSSSHHTWGWGFCSRSWGLCFAERWGGRRVDTGQCFIQIGGRVACSGLWHRDRESKYMPFSGLAQPSWELGKAPDSSFLPSRDQPALWQGG